MNAIESDYQLEALMRFARAVICLGALASLAASPVPGGGRYQPAMPVIVIDAVSASAGDTDYLFRLGLMEGHLIIGHQLLQAKRPELALPHFGHPVREIYDDISDYLSDHKFPGFDKQLAVLEASAASAPDSPDTEQKYQAIIATIHKARELAPATVRASVPDTIKICADTIDAASGEFNEALEQGRVANMVEYHDSRGYLEYASQQLKGAMAANQGAASDAMLKRLQDLLVKAQWIVEPLLPDPKPRASVSDFRGIARQALDLGKEAQKGG
jgi:hypothetical protein